MGAGDNALRARIIGEIRRLAAETGGQAPGQRRFAQVTGISARRWCGVLWARWNEAVAESACVPNAPDQRLPEAEVLARLAAAVRRLGRMPTEAELRLLHRRGESAIGPRRLAKSFPARAAQVAALRAWVAGQPDYADVAALLPAGAAAPPAAARPPAPPLPPSGMVYLIAWRDLHRLASAPHYARRETAAELYPADGPQVEHVIETDDPVGIEAYWRQRFAARRVDSEWHRLMPADLAAFRRRGFQ
jgi:hypothetical protein